MQSLLRSTVVLAFSLLGPWFSSVIGAQELPEQKSSVSDEELKAFAKAYVEVDKIRLAYEPSLQKAQDPLQTRNIQQEALTKMEKAVQDQGLTGESYVRIFNTVKDDAELRGKTIKLIKEEEQKP